MEDIVVVIGGWNYNNPINYEDARLDSTELLINGESEWQQGKYYAKLLKCVGFPSFVGGILFLM